MHVYPHWNPSAHTVSVKSAFFGSTTNAQEKEVWQGYEQKWMTTSILHDYSQKKSDNFINQSKIKLNIHTCREGY